MKGELDVDDFVRHYYGEVLESSGDLKTNACCTLDDVPDYVSELFENVHEEVNKRYYGCGLVVPELLEGARVLDLGCGAGRDCYALAQLVGGSGEVIGVDMTEAQLEVAERYLDYHTERFGLSRPNVRFVHGHIEHLDAIGLEPGSVDVIVSNCVINLARDKRAVLRGAESLLKPGGELYFADVYADRRVPESVRDDPVLYGECLGGALYWNDFLSMAKAAGFADPRLVTDRPIEITDASTREAVNGVRFFTATYRLFNLPALEPAREDYGQTVRYLGTIPHQAARLKLDKHESFEAGETKRVCGNTFAMLAESRFSAHFDLHGDRSQHLGAFDHDGPAGLPFDSDAPSPGSGCC